MKKRVKDWLLSIIYYFRKKNSYSQDGEDMVLASFFEGKNNYGGFYIDVGAHHPVRFSNTYHFYKKGWSGINIDPTPGSMVAFNLLRRRDINLELGVGTQSGYLRFYKFNEPALNTFNPTLAEQRNLLERYHIKEVLQVEIKPLSLILEKWLTPGKKVDFLSVDAEGFDLEVLTSNDWNKCTPDYVLVEDEKVQLLSENKSEITNYLQGNGYELVAKVKRTSIFRHRSVPI